MRTTRICGALGALLVSLVFGCFSFSAAGALYQSAAKLAEGQGFATDPVFHWVGQVSYNDGVSQLPIGTAVAFDSNWILTAGHVPTVAESRGAISFAFTVGTGASQVTVQADRVVLHPQWPTTNVDPGHYVDVALIHLATPLGDGVPFPDIYGGPDVRNTTMTIAGFGAPALVGTQPLSSDGILRGGTNVATKFGSDYPDGSISEWYWMMNYDRAILSQPIEWGSTPGDSGAPYFAYVNDEWQIVGVNSFVTGYNYGNYSVGVRTSYIHDWAESVSGVVLPEPGVVSCVIPLALVVLSHRRRW